MIVYLKGWQKTIGVAPANNPSARFIHNHLLHDVAIVCAGFDSADRWIVQEEVRAAAYAALIKCVHVFVGTAVSTKNSVPWIGNAP
jgi:hypothetical protein